MSRFSFMSVALKYSLYDKMTLYKIYLKNYLVFEKQNLSLCLKGTYNTYKFEYVGRISPAQLVWG